MGGVHRSGTHQELRRARRRAKKPCYSAPAAPSNVTLTFGRREVLEREEWRGRVTWDPVTQDAAGRPINVELYRVELRATDASGEPVETAGQAQTFSTDGADFTVAAGSAPVNGRAREIDAPPDEIRASLTNLTAGIEAQVHFLLAKSGASAPTLRCSVWDVTAGAEVVAKQRAPDKNRPTVEVSLRFTPAAGRSYEVRVAYSAGSGTALVHQVQWHDVGDAAVWRERVSSDQDLRSSFPIVRPRTWYYQARVSAGRRVGGRLCWGAWSAWTNPVLPATGETVGPPQVTGVSLTFVRDESRRGSPWVALATWNEVPWWVPPDGEAQEGAARYDLKLEVRPAGGSSATSTRRVSVAARDADTDQTASHVFTHISRKREYRLAVRPVDPYGRLGAWSPFTAWSRPPALTSPVTNLQWRHPKPRLYVATWDPPAGDYADAVIGYRVRVYRGGSPSTGTLVESTDVGLAQRYSYHVPAEDKGKDHSVRVVALYEGSLEEGSASDSTAITEGETWSTPDLEENSVVSPTIMPGSVGAGQLAGLVQLASRIVSGDPAGARLEINETGLTLYNASGDALVSLAAGDEPSVQAHIRALSLVALGVTLLQDTTVTNTARLILERKVSDPSVAPALSVGFPGSKQLKLKGDGTNTDAVYDWFGLFYASTGGADGTVPVFWTTRPGGAGYYRYIQEHKASDGTFNRAIVLPEPSTDDAWGVVQVTVGTTRYVYVLYQKWTDPPRYYLRKYAASDLSFVAETQITSYIVAPKPGLFTDGTYLYVLTTHSTADNTHLHVLIFNADTLAYVGVFDLDNSFTIGGGSGGGRAFESGGGVIVGGKLYLALYTYENAPVRRRGIFAFDWTTKARSPGDDFLGQTGAEADGVTHDGTNFRSVVYSNPVVTHSDWTDISNPVWMAYTWRDSVNGYESAVSPIVSTTMRRRAWLTVTWPSFPTGVDRARTYAAIAASKPSASSLKRQGTHTGNSTALGSFDSAGVAPPSSSTFPGSGHGAELRTSDGAPLVRADGMSRCRVVSSTAQSIPNSSNQPVAFASGAVQVDTDSYAQPSPSNRFQIPFAGQYLIQVGGRWAANATGLRRLLLQRSTDGGSTWTGLDAEGARDDRVPVTGAPTQQSFAVTVSLTAGTLLRVIAFQNSGGALDLQSFNLSIVFIGPA